MYVHIYNLNKDNKIMWIILFNWPFIFPHFLLFSIFLLPYSLFYLEAEMNLVTAGSRKDTFEFLYMLALFSIGNIEIRLLIHSAISNSLLMSITLPSIDTFCETYLSSAHRGVVSSRVPRLAYHLSCEPAEIWRSNRARDLNPIERLWVT